MKKLLFCMLTVICTLMIGGTNAHAADTNGTCGDNLTWIIEEETLYINGTGEMTDYAYYNDSPWKFRKDVKKIVVGEGVTKIGTRAFITCMYATSIELPKTLTTIGDWAFYQCEALKDINIPESVVSIGYSAFGYCTHLENANIADSVTDFGNSAFYACSSLKNVKIGCGISEIGSSTFSRCFNMTSIIIPDNVKEISSTAFRGCTGLKIMYAPYSLKPYVRNLDDCGGNRKYYYVIRYILNDELLKKEYVYEGNNAILPEAPTGYTYSFSENGTEWDGKNVKGDAMVYVISSKNPESSVEITDSKAGTNSIKYISTVEASANDEIKSFGTVFIPYLLVDDENAESTHVSYSNDEYDIEGSITFGATLTDIPYSCKDLDIVGRSYVELADGRYIWSTAKYASINDIILKIMEEE